MAKVVFCQRVVYAYFGTMSISAVLKQHGHAVDLVMCSSLKKMVQETIALRPDMVAFSTLVATGDFEWALEVAREIKARLPTVVVLIGGLHPTIFPDESLNNDVIDVACIGEGEGVMLDICNALDKGEEFLQVEGTYVRTQAGIHKNPLRPLIEDLDVLPFHDREIYQKYKYFDRLYSTDMLAGRHCPFACSYCYNHVVKKIFEGKGRTVRKHSVDYVIAELKQVKEEYKPKAITFMDELFAIDKEWIREFSQKYPKEIGLKFVCAVRADLMDEEMTRLLKEAGAKTVCIGLESGNEKIRIEFLRKTTTDAQILQMAEHCHKYEIEILTANIVGYPGETLEQAFETIYLNRRIKTAYLYYCMFMPYPKLDVTERMIASGAIPDIPADQYPSTFFRKSLIKQDNMRQLENLHKLYLPILRLPRLEKFFRWLIKLPPNIIYDLVFMASYGWMQYRCFKRNPFQLIWMGIGNAKIFFWKDKGFEPNKK